MIASHLRAGNTKSCGKPSCRAKRTPVRSTRKRDPNGCRVLSLTGIQQAWATYYHDDNSKQRSIPQLAKRHNVSASTLYDIFRVVRDVGGIEDYVSMLEDK